MNDQALREHLDYVLGGGGAHLDFEKAFLKGHKSYDTAVGDWWHDQASNGAHRKAYALSIMLAGVGLAGVIGISRLYLNVHWLSDVLGGFTLAAAYLCLSIGFLETHKRRAHDICR